ncbi:class F sortase [Streptomyces sp. NPDC004647]|uniref:class F sortase n=1 Tax=Streptomyces sp. NPDC004647 TaxID=3154671 RepID=UPI0033A5D419
MTTAVLVVTGLSQQEPAPPKAVPAPQAPAQGGSSQGDPQSPEGQAGGGSGAQKAQAMQASAPERIAIPSLKVSSTLENLGKGASGAMETPRDPDKAGWYTPGPTPGATGPAVIAGHVTWNGARSVFFGLSQLKSGDKIDVSRRDGSTAEFTVDRIAQYPKNKFPTLEVYRNLDHAGLRLITCGGEFSKAKHYYKDNVVVYASLTGSRQ